MTCPLEPTDQKLNDFAQTDEEAQKRFGEHRSKDPFPEIRPALLNSADICDYVAKTGMIFPFYPDKKRLKPASYALALGGQCIYWDAEGKEKEFTIGPGNTFTLQSDSIAFLMLEPMFRLPDYIALRFNLRITLVYRGLLVGTGPLVDPGFQGKLHLPLHNLTTNDYVLKGGEALVWVEFTKLSDNKIWANEQEEERDRIGRYVPFPDNKKDLTLRQYLAKAAPNRPIRSSIPDAIATAEQAATEAKKETTTWGKILSWGALAAFVALISLVVSIYSLNASTHNLIGDAVDYVSSAQGEVRASQEQRFGGEAKIEALEQEIDGLLRRIEQLELQTAPTDEVMESSSTRPQTR